jgi:hypothetical protein
VKAEHIEDVAAGERGADARPRAARLQRALVVGQLAVSLVLFTGPGRLEADAIHTRRSPFAAASGFRIRPLMIPNAARRVRRWDDPSRNQITARVAGQLRSW